MGVFEQVAQVVVNGRIPREKGESVEKKNYGNLLMEERESVQNALKHIFDSQQPARNMTVEVYYTPNPTEEGIQIERWYLGLNGHRTIQIQKRQLTLLYRSLYLHLRLLPIFRLKRKSLSSIPLSYRIVDGEPMMRLDVPAAVNKIDLFRYESPDGSLRLACEYIKKSRLEKILADGPRSGGEQRQRVQQASQSQPIGIPAARPRAQTWANNMPEYPSSQPNSHSSTPNSGNGMSYPHRRPQTSQSGSQPRYKKMMDAQMLRQPVNHGRSHTFSNSRSSHDYSSSAPINIPQTHGGFTPQPRSFKESSLQHSYTSPSSMSDRIRPSFNSDIPLSTSSGRHQMIPDNSLQSSFSDDLPFASGTPTSFSPGNSQFHQEHPMSLPRNTPNFSRVLAASPDVSRQHIPDSPVLGLGQKDSPLMSSITFGGSNRYDEDLPFAIDIAGEPEGSTVDDFVQECNDAPSLSMFASRRVNMSDSMAQLDENLKSVENDVLSFSKMVPQQ